MTQLVAPLGVDYDDLEGDYAELAIDAAAERGTIMHEYIHYRLLGGEREDYEIPGEYEPYADAVELFLAEHAINPYLIEIPLGCAEYAGTPDLVAEFDGVTSILDWKFVSQIAKSKVMAQLGGYRRLCETNGIYPDKLYAVQFLRDGTYRLYPVDESDALNALGACTFIHSIKTQKHPRGKIGGLK